MVSRYQQHRPARLELVSRNEAKPARILRHAAAPARWFTHAADIAELVTVFERRVDALMAARDARAAFCGAYGRYLAGVREAIASGAVGEGAGWVERLELEHAHQYLRAMDAWDRGDACLTPAPWRLVFSIDRHQTPSVAEALRMGALVHLAYDLRWRWRGRA